MGNKVVPYHNLIKVALWSSLFVFFFSCDVFNNDTIASLNGNNLSEKELTDRIKLYFPYMEYKEAKEKAIQQWAEEQRVSLEIEKKLPHNKYIEDLKIKTDLAQIYLYELENEYIKNNLDTNITYKEIQSFYDLHRSDYKKESYIIQGLYLKLPDTLAQMLNIEKHYLLKSDKDFQEVKEIGNLYASSFYLEQERWIYLEDLMREIPISSVQKEELVKNKKHDFFSIDGETHYINILNYRIKTIDSPLLTEEEKIRQHILTSRATQLRTKAKEIILKNVEKKYPIHYH